jgi:hypothetical protein
MDLQFWTCLESPSGSVGQWRCPEGSGADILSLGVTEWSPLFKDLDLKRVSRRV